MSYRKSTYKDMNKFRRTKYLGRKRYYAQTSFKYPRRPWSDEEDKLVVEHKITDRELSEQIERSVSAIQGRRAKLKREAEL